MVDGVVAIVGGGGGKRGGIPGRSMILEAKSDGRKKGRLILQGFREPRSWDRGPTE